MGSIVAVRRCFEYNPEEIAKHIAWLYTESDGPDPAGKKILLKPNILSDDDPVKAITTHPVVVEAVIRYLQSRGATVFVGDSPTFDTRKFTGEKSGIRQVVNKCGATWVRFNDAAIFRKVGTTEIKITALITKVDLIISLSKLKNHELMIFSGAMKNIFGFVPAFNKAMQHVKYPDRYKFGKFFVDLEEAIKPHFHIMDGIVALEGPGPGNGYPKKVNVLLASVNPLALDIIASRIVGYNPLEIPTNKIALERGFLLKNMDDIIIKGTDPATIVVRDFKRIDKGGEAGIIFKYFKKKIPFLRRFNKRPVFNSKLCIGCSKCIDICPVKTLRFDNKKKNKVLVNEAKCIHCYCCHEVCREMAIEIKRKVF
ncbi:MAG: DUF362 domain-containing protein [Bacteroidales bacterium]|jgi:uncharacterized protein (DUF362 family)/NAD-dependent dihydropyrimidine dehydrogenase PreA subunit